VRVEPDEEVFLVDRLDGLEDRGDQRVRLARLTAGELVFVVGTATHGFDPMQGGYRDGAVGFVVRRSRGQRMLVSTEPLTERHKKLARDDGKLALLLLLGLLLTHGLVFLRAWTLRLGGHVTNALIMDTDSYQTYSRNKYGGGHWVSHYRLTISPKPNERIGEGSIITEDTSPYCYWRAKEEKIDHVPLLEAGPFRQLGTEAAISELTAIFYPMVAIPYVLILLAWRARSRPWYLKRKLNERVGGRLDPGKYEFQ
jgi:hypothetical protein